MANVSLATIKKRTASLASLGTTDLAIQEKVDALVRTAVEVNEQFKAYKEEDDRVKSEFKRICAPYIEHGQKVTCYAFDQGKKMTITYSGGGMSIDDETLLRKLYDHYGESYGDRAGRAWEAFCKVSDPVDIPRKVNEDKLMAEIARSERVLNGIEVGEALVTAEIVRDVAVDKAPSVVAKCANMTKAEVKAHDSGELVETLALS